MDATKLTAIVSVILALSIASERLVEIVKGLWPFLTQQNPDPVKEGWRKSILQLLAVVAGVFTAFMSRDYLPSELASPAGSWQVLGLGLLASGGSAFWNAILTYMLKLKDLKKQEADAQK